jgi:hydroxypyruvate reductase
MLKDAAIMREHCISIFQSGVAAADPQQAVKRCLFADSEQLKIRLAAFSSQIRTDKWQKIHIIAFGKAAVAMAIAARQTIPKALQSEPGLIVTTAELLTTVEGFEVFAAGHPIPDQNGLNAARVIAERLAKAQADELVLLLISGGGSALLPYPVDGVSLADKIATTELLLACGADINQINCVRKHLSKFKGGGMAKLATPADLHALILSDVLGDDLSTIASGPSVADPTHFRDAISILKEKQVWQQTPASVQIYLQQGADQLHPETLKTDDAVLIKTSHSLIASNAISVSAAINAAQQLGYQTHLYSDQLTGEAHQIAEQWLLACKTQFADGLMQPLAMIAGGETTVTLTGTGKGGRNQEMALAFALAEEQQPLNCAWHFLSAGTDGRDGPTDAAGGMVNRDTLSKVRLAGIDPHAALVNNDSYTALKAADDLLITGATGTNVADLQVLLLHPQTN